MRKRDREEGIEEKRLIGRDYKGDIDMKIGRVIGTVVCSQKEPSLEGIKLLLLQPLAEDLSGLGDPLVACDTVQAGEGDIVLFEGGREAALALKNWFNPTDAAVMGIVDRLDIAASQPQRRAKHSVRNTEKKKGQKK